MRKFAILFAFAASTLAADPGLDARLKALENRYNRAQTLQVHFTEGYTGPGQPERSESGMLSLRKPGRMRWDYTAPAGKLFISDGKNVYLYLPSANRVEKMKLKESEDMRVPLAFLLGKLNFQKEFQNITERPEGTGMLISAEPKSPDLPYSRVEFSVAPDLQIRRLKVIGQDKSVLDFLFEQERLNPSLDSKLFEFRIPRGAQLIEAGQ